MFTKIAPGESFDFLPLQPLNPNRSGMPIWEAVVAGSLRERKVHGRDFWVENSAKMQLQKGISDVL